MLQVNHLKLDKMLIKNRNKHCLYKRAILFKPLNAYFISAKARCIYYTLGSIFMREREK